MKLFLKLLGLLVGIPTVGTVLFFWWASAGTADKQTYADTFAYDAPSATPQDSYTIVSYNIGYLSGLANNTTERPEQSLFTANQEKAVAALQAVNPDIVGFQEIDIEAKRSYGVNQVEALAKALGMRESAIAVNWDKNYLPFPYWPLSAHFGKIFSGQAIISRYPIENNSRIVLERVADKNFVFKAFYLDRLAQVSRIEIDGKTLVVISVHLEAFDEATRVRQTQFVRSLAEDHAKTNPVILMGDFNSALNRPTFVSAQGDTYEETQFSIKEILSSERLTSAVPQENWTGKNATFPADSPEYKLDYLFYTPDTLEVLTTQVLSSAGEASDHLPLMMQFRFK
ncbi:MAG: endonuclease/exonuclease/phosphatase family protein [Cyanobacteria bacterium P01_D01_bin.36]